MSSDKTDMILVSKSKFNQEETIRQLNLLLAENGWKVIKHIISRRYYPLIVQSRLRRKEELLISFGKVKLNIEKIIS